MTPCRVLIVGEAWGQSEETLGGVPFIGASGKELFKILGEAGWGDAARHGAARRVMWNGDEYFSERRAEWLRDASVTLTNVFALRPPGNKLEYLCVSKPEASQRSFSLGPLVRSPRHLYAKDEFLPHLDRLRDEVATLRPNLIFGLGATSNWAFGAGGFGDHRGTVSLVYGRQKFLSTYHPANILRQWSNRSVVVADAIKAWKESTTPEFSRPQRFVLINPELEDIEKWLSNFLSNSTRTTVLSCDIETKGGQITSIGFAASRKNSIVVPFVSMGENSFRSYWRDAYSEARAWNLCQQILSTPNSKVFQNGLYDLQWLRARGLQVRNVDEDTMLLHHAIHPEMRKGLGFLGSLYTSEPAWKVMRRRGKDEGEKAEE